MIRDDNGRVKLLCKGADSVIFKLADLTKCTKVEEVNHHLEEYSLIGLRTLLLSERIIPEDVYEAWNEKY